MLQNSGYQNMVFCGFGNRDCDIPVNNAPAGEDGLPVHHDGTFAAGTLAAAGSIRMQTGISKHL